MYQKHNCFPRLISNITVDLATISTPLRRFSSLQKQNVLVVFCAVWILYNWTLHQLIQLCWLNLQQNLLMWPIRMMQTLSHQRRTQPQLHHQVGHIILLKIYPVCWPPLSRYEMYRSKSVIFDWTVAAGTAARIVGYVNKLASTAVMWIICLSPWPCKKTYSVLPKDWNCGDLYRQLQWFS